jgi:indolepyruvate decarboxylase
MRGLRRLNLRARKRPMIAKPKVTAAYRPSRSAGPISVKRLFQRLNAFLSEETMVVADVGDALFGAADLFIRHSTEFLGPAYYASMGFAVPACVGAQLARPGLRPLVLVGDGAFQMTGMELATVARYKLNPIVVVLNNSGYGTERHMQDGPYNDLWPWQYHKVPEVLGAGRGFLVRNEMELEEALETSRAHAQSFCLLDVHLDPLDRSPALQRLAERLARRL